MICRGGKNGWSGLAQPDLAAEDTDMGRASPAQW